MANKHPVSVDKDKCIGCGLCASDCVGSIIKIVDGKANVKDNGCIACGHCEAICPVNAIVLDGFEEESVEYNEQTRLNPETLLQAIKTRRTIRNFTDQKVDQEIIDKIIEAGRLAPTGVNAQNTSFIILGSKQRELEDIALGAFRKLIKIGKVFVPFLKGFNLDDNFFFKKAPLVILVCGDSVNGGLAAENMAFMVEAYGLGVLFSGFFTTVANKIGKIKKILGNDKKVVTTLVIGYPGVKYHRTVKREPAKVKTL